MIYTIKYQIKNGTVRRKAFIKESRGEAVKFFNWRYGHKILKVTHSH